MTTQQLYAMQRVNELQAVRDLLLPDSDDPRVMSELTSVELALIAAHRELIARQANAKSNLPVPANASDRDRARENGRPREQVPSAALQARTPNISDSETQLKPNDHQHHSTCLRRLRRYLTHPAVPNPWRYRQATHLQSARVRQAVPGSQGEAPCRQSRLLRRRMFGPGGRYPPRSAPTDAHSHGSQER